MIQVFAPLGLLMALLLLTGCASRLDTVVFVTKTSLGVDVEQTPPTASIAYDRVEGYFGPRPIALPAFALKVLCVVMNTIFCFLLFWALQEGLL